MNSVNTRKSLHLIFKCSIALSLLILSLQGSCENASSEYKLKAALLYKLAKFIEWPDNQHTSKTESFELCVLGENYFGKTLNALEDRKADNRNIKVHYLDQSETVSGKCDLVFISDSKKAFLTSILEALKAQPVLTVGDMEQFAEQGGIVQFTAGKRIGFKINNEAAKLADLKIAAPLLQLATIVNTKE